MKNRESSHWLSKMDLPAGGCVWVGCGGPECSLIPLRLKRTVAESSRLTSGEVQSTRAPAGNVPQRARVYNGSGAASAARPASRTVYPRKLPSFR